MRATIAPALYAIFMANAAAQILTAPTGGAGGLVTGGSTIEAQISTGDHFHGGVTDVVATIQDNGGYTGQLYDPKSLTVAASSATVPETATRQLSANALLDDDTTLALDGAEIAWSVQSGALAGVDADGLVTASTVYADSPGTAEGDWLGLEGSLTLTVLDTLADNFGSYAGDEIDDDWQVGFFGLDNPAAAPAADPDGDTQTNLLEFLALVDPTDPESIFFADLTATDAVTFSPVATGRTYTLLASPDLTPANFSPVASTASDSAGWRTLTHSAPPAGARRFYRIEISN